MDLLHFIETPIFQRKIDGLLSADEYQKFQAFLGLDAKVGDTIAGTGGCRKVRWALPGIGKSGGIRVIYYYLTRDGEIYLLIAYPKNEKDSLTNSEKIQLKKVIEAIEGTNERRTV